jgi:beta-fructofuranosidase
MNYRPDPKELILWDTWMFPEPEGKRMHLFFLANQPDKEWEWVGHAVSDDLIHWQDLPAIQLRRPGDAYDIGAAGTGMVFASPSGGFMLSYTANLGGPVQGIAFLHSRDLIHWEKRWPEPRMIAELPYYQTDGTQTPCKISPFRDAFIHRVGDHYEALIGAQSPQVRRWCEDALPDIRARTRNCVSGSRWPLWQVRGSRP